MSSDSNAEPDDQKLRQLLHFIERSAQGRLRRALHNLATAVSKLKEEIDKEPPS